MVTENAQEHADVGGIRDIFKGQRFAREQRGDHQWKRRVLGAGNPYDAIQRLAADDPNTIQGTPRFQKMFELVLFYPGPVLRKSSRRAVLLSAASPVCFARSLFCSLRRMRFARNALARRWRAAALCGPAAPDKAEFPPSGTGRSWEPDKLMSFRLSNSSCASVDMVSQAARAKSLVERNGGQGKAPRGLWRARTGLPNYCTPLSAATIPRQRSHAEGRQGLAGRERRTGTGSTGSINRGGSRKFDAAVSRKNAYIISNAYPGTANPPRVIRARSWRVVLFPSRSHRITFPGSKRAAAR